MMKTNILPICLSGLLAFGAVISLTGCGDKFQEEYPWMVGKQEDQNNEDEEGAGSHDMEICERELRGAIPFMINYSHEPTGSWMPHKYQYYRTNTIDNYAGYWTTTKANFAFGPALPTLYTDDNGYMGGPLDNQIFQQSKNAVLYAATMTDDKGNDISRPEWRAVALIIQAYMGHEVVDFFGVAPFNDWRINKRTTLTWESGPSVYKQILADLDEAIEILKERQPSIADFQRVEGTDANKTAFDYDWRRWVKFANSIKLRMAMNMVDYIDAEPVYGPDNKPFLSKNIAEEAVNDEIGVLTTGDRDIAYVSNGTWQCCLYFMGSSWNDIRLGASLENILKHFRSPLLTEWFDENAYDIKNANGVRAPRGIYGVRAGLMMEDTGAPDKGGYGPFAVLSTRQQYMDQPFFKVAEVLFLRAEGALRGWNMGGDPRYFYEEGMRRGMRQFNVDEAAIEAYINQTNLPRVDYIDYYKRMNDIEGRVLCDVKWNEGDSKELKLEKIITQKYIHNFPMGAEAWTNFRRTGYPRLFPVMFNNMVGVDTEMQIRRCTIIENANNAIEVGQISSLLGGEQTAGTRVFWDINSRSWRTESYLGKYTIYVPDNHLN